jgi:uncharacterized protein YdbL (DUF1318 family)
MKRLALILLALGMNVQAAALTLNDARAQGRVGKPSAAILPRFNRMETLALVNRINAARTENYQKLADSNNLPVDEVAKMAGQKLVARAQPGEYVKGINGKWLKK